MALSYQEVVSNGSLNTLALGIEFTAQEDISVLYDGAILPYNSPTGRSWIWSDGTTIRFRNDGENAPIPAGVVIRAERNTNVEEIRHVFSVQAGGGGSAKFTNQTMDENFQQFLFTAQESVERTDEAQAAVDQAILAADGAVLTANAANATANTALSTANAAINTANSVIGVADQALNIAQGAENTANSIDGKATQALADAGTAVSVAYSAANDASNAMNTANGIAGTANTALSTANQAAADASTALDVAEGIEDIANTALTNSQTALDVASGAAQKSANLGDLANVVTARDNLGLGAVAVLHADAISLVKPDVTRPCLIKTGAGTLSLEGGVQVRVQGVYRTFPDIVPVTMPSLVAGEDYSVWVGPTGAPYAVPDPYESQAAEAGATRIGGFHYSLVAPGTTVAGGAFATAGPGFIWTQSDVDLLAGINSFSIWDLGWRCLGEQRGMTLEPYTKLWHAIYFASPDTDLNGISRNATAVASGTVLPKVPAAYGGDGTATYSRLSFYEALEIVSSHGLLLYDYSAACTGFFGVTENQSLGGGSVTIPATTRQPGYTSRIGVEQATGHEWVIGGPVHSVGGTDYQSNPGRGSFYGTTGLPLFGGSRNDAADSGSRAASFNIVPWSSYWALAVRAVGCHFQFN